MHSADARAANSGFCYVCLRTEMLAEKARETHRELQITKSVKGVKQLGFRSGNWVERRGEFGSTQACLRG